MMLLGRSTDGLIYVFEHPVRLLVVDDDPIMREFAIAQLSHPGGEIVTAGDGEEAWSRLQEDGRFDLVLSDLEMPTMNGFALVEQIRSSPRHAHLPVVVITSRDDMFAIDRAYEVGATSFATKPVNWRLLGYQLRYVLRGWRMEAQVRRAHEDAERTSRLRDNLLTLLQHETRTPLNAIVGYTELVKQAAGGAGGVTLPFLDDLKQAGFNLNRILQRIFYFAQLTSGTLELAQENISLSNLIEEATRACAQTARSRGIDLNAVVNPACLRIMADHDHLLRALDELVVNALTSSPDASHVSIHASGDEAGGVFVEISDQGAGLEEAALLIRKEPFMQIEDPLSRSKSGLGLGIPTARRVIELHGGTLAFAPSPAGGVTARITLPGNAGRSERPGDRDTIRSDRTAA
jgi:two-component system, sensor histidine kinase and response regulator